MLGTGLVLAAPTAGNAAPAAPAAVVTPTPAQLTAQYWQWAQRTPVHTSGVVTHPVLDTGPTSCGLGQQASGTWFLGGRYAGVNALTVARSCTIPVTKKLWVPIGATTVDNAECDGVPDGTATTAQLRAAAHRALAQATTRTATIDGKPVPTTAITTATSTVFSYTTVFDSLVNNYYCLPQGKVFQAQTVTGAVAEATYFQPTLTVGKHTVRTVLKDSAGVNVGTVTYYLTITA